MIFMSLATSGAWQLFFGHVEYYPILGVAVLSYIVLAVAAVQGRCNVFWTWPAFAVLPTLHLSAICLAPAQIYVGMHGWKTKPKWIAALGPVAGMVLFLLLSRLRVAGGENLFAATANGVKGYLELYSASGSSRYVFDFFSAAHALAVLNDLVLLAPIALVVVAVGPRKLLPLDSVGVFLSIAASFCVLASMLFNREIGAYRDWDALAPYAFVTSAWAGRHLARSHRDGIAIVWMLAMVALLHVSPWVLMNADSGATERHIRIALTEPDLWSPYARGYMHEEFAIRARDEGDLASAFKEYSAAARASPRDPRYRLGVADMAFALGNLETAARHYEETLMLVLTFLPRTIT